MHGEKKTTQKMSFINAREIIQHKDKIHQKKIYPAKKKQEK